MKHRKIWSTVAIYKIKIPEMENESLFMKYTTLENSHLYQSIYDNHMHSLRIIHR